MTDLLINIPVRFQTQDAAQIALARVDALAAQAVDWAAPIRFRVAHSEDERQAAYHLRYQAVIEHGWEPPQDLPAGLEYDAYDEHAVHIVAWDADQPVATCRLVWPQPGLPLPTEEAFELHFEPGGEVVDAGRFVVARAYSGMAHRLLACLLARTWIEVRANGYARVCAAFASQAMIRVFSRMGFHFTVLAAPRRYWGTERSPLLFDISASADALLENWSPDLSPTP